MSKYLDIATKKRELFPNSQAQSQPKKSFEEIQTDLKASQKRADEKIRNPLAVRVQEGVSKKLGSGTGAQFAGGVLGSLVKGIERPVRFLVGGGYGITKGIQGAMGNKQAAEDFKNNINPYMTQEDMKRMKDPRDNTIAIEKGAQMSGDVIPYILPGGTSLKTRAGFGAVSGFSSGMAEPDKDIRSVLTNTAVGAGTGLLIGAASKGVNKLRSVSSKSPTLRSGATPLIDSPEVNNKMLPSGEVQSKSLINQPSSSSTSTIVPESQGTPSSSNMVKSSVNNAVEDIPSEITYRRNPVKDALTGFKSQLSKFGENGKKLSQLLDSYENTSAVKSATSLNKFKSVFDTLKTQSKTGLAKDAVAPDDNQSIINYLLDIYNGKQPRAVTPEQKAVAESFFRDVTLEPSALAKKVGLTIDGKPLGKPRPFVPLIPKDINKFKQAHLERLKSMGMSTQKAKATISEVIDDMFNPSTRVSGKKFPGFENRRFFEPKSYQDLVDYGYESDIGKIAESWSNKAWKRIEGIQHFGGVKYEGLNSVLDDLKKQGADMKDIEYIKRSFITFLEGRPLENQEYEKFVSAVKDIGSLKLSPSSGIKQPISLAQNFAIVGPKKSLKTLSKLVSGKISAEEKRVINNAGLLLEDRFDTGLMNRSPIVTGAESAKELGTQVLSKELGVGDKVAATLKGLARLNFKFTGIRQLDAGIRKLSGYSSYEWIKNSMDDLSSGKVTGKKRDALIEQLNVFAFPNKKELLSAIDNGGNLTDEQLSKAIHHFVKKTQFGVSRSELPASWSNSATGEMVTTLRSYGFEQAQFVGRLWDLGKKTGNWGPLTTYLTAATSIGYGVKQVNDSVMKTITGEEDKNKALDTIYDLAGQAMLGVYWDTIKFSGFTSGAVGIVGGPAASEVVDVLNTGKTTFNNFRSGKQDPTKELRSFLAKRTVGKAPFVGAKAVESIKGERRSSSSRKKTRY